MQQYIVLDEDGVAIATGNSRQLASKFGACFSTIAKYERNKMVFRNRYRIIKVVEEKVDKKKIEKESKIRYLKEHLLLHGNTCLGNEKESDVKSYIAELKKLGINAAAIGKKDSGERWWLIEVCYD